MKRINESPRMFHLIEWTRFDGTLESLPKFADPELLFEKELFLLIPAGQGFPFSLAERTVGHLFFDESSGRLAWETFHVDYLEDQVFREILPLTVGDQWAYWPDLPLFGGQVFSRTRTVEEFFNIL